MKKKTRDMLTQSYLIYHGLAASVAEKKTSVKTSKKTRIKRAKGQRTAFLLHFLTCSERAKL